jgi:endonuclease YncB( thermonuclease family)
VQGKTKLKNLVDFWKKDIINKMIVLVLLLLLLAGAAFIFMLFNLPGGKSPFGIVNEFFPSTTPTVNVDAVFTGLAQTVIVEQTPAYMRGPATITPAGLRPTGVSTTLPEPTGTPTPTLTQVQITPAGASATPTVTASPVSQAIAGITCILAGTPQTGRVLDILDGVSVKVMLDGLVYTVRYIGVDLPGDAGYAEAASLINGRLVWGRDVQLYADLSDKDALGQLMRYLVIDDKLVNLELIKSGLASVLDIPAGFACAQVFRDAEQAARTANLGMWHK